MWRAEIQTNRHRKSTMATCRWFDRREIDSAAAVTSCSFPPLLHPRIINRSSLFCAQAGVPIISDTRICQCLTTFEPTDGEKNAAKAPFHESANPPTFHHRLTHGKEKLLLFLPTSAAPTKKSPPAHCAVLMTLGQINPSFSFLFTAQNCSPFRQILQAKDPEPTPEKKLWALHKCNIFPKVLSGNFIPFCARLVRRHRPTPRISLRSQQKNKQPKRTTTGLADEKGISFLRSPSPPLANNNTSTNSGGEGRGAGNIIHSTATTTLTKEEEEKGKPKHIVCGLVCMYRKRGGPPKPSSRGNAGFPALTKASTISINSFTFQIRKNKLIWRCSEVFLKHRNFELFIRENWRFHCGSPFQDVWWLFLRASKLRGLNNKKKEGEIGQRQDEFLIETGCLGKHSFWYDAFPAGDKIAAFGGIFLPHFLRYFLVGTEQWEVRITLPPYSHNAPPPRSARRSRSRIKKAPLCSTKGRKKANPLRSPAKPRRTKKGKYSTWENRFGWQAFRLLDRDSLDFLASRPLLSFRLISTLFEKIKGAEYFFPLSYVRKANASTAKKSIDPIFPCCSHGGLATPAHKKWGGRTGQNTREKEEQ